MNMLSFQDSLENVRVALRSIDWQRVRANPILLAWISAASLSVAVPSVQWYLQRSSYYKSYGYAVDYENQQRDYEEQQNQNNDENNDDTYGSVYESCSGWNWWCIQKQAYYANYYGDDKQNEDDGGTDEMTIPNWFIYIGGETEDMQKWEEENTGVRQEENTSAYSGTQTFVCVWTVLMFLAIVAYGARTLYSQGCRRSLVVLSLLFAQFCFLNILMLPSGAISSEDRQMEDSVYGWYGQVGVLLAYINIWFLAFTVLFPIAFFVCDYIESKKFFLNTESTPTADGEYHNFEVESNKTSDKKDLGTLA